MELVLAIKKQAGASVIKAGMETNVFQVTFSMFLIVEKSSNTASSFFSRKGIYHSIRDTSVCIQEALNTWRGRLHHFLQLLYNQKIQKVILK